MHSPHQRRRLLSRLLPLLLPALLLIGCSDPEANDPPPAWIPISDFGPNPGDLDAVLFLPESVGPNPTLITLLHGCLQRGPDYAINTGWLTLARQAGWILLIPSQNRWNNPWGCFNWFDMEAGGGGREEADSVMAMIASVQAAHGVDPRRSFITGLSAGAALSAALLVQHPDRFAGGALVAGVPFGCASGAVSGVLCMMRGRDLDAQEWAAQARAAAPAGFAGPWPRVAIWQGDDDGIVDPVNAWGLVEQWTGLHAIELPDGADEPSLTAGGAPIDYRDAQGRPAARLRLIPGMPHGQPIDPQSGCGVAGADSYIFPVDQGLCASREIARFWGLAAP